MMSPKHSITGNRAHILQIASAVRDAAGPHIRRMIDRLVYESEHAERDTARTAAARAVVQFAIDGARLAHEVESGEQTGNTGTSITLMVAQANHAPRLASPDEMRETLAAISESVRAEAESVKK